MNRTQKIIVSIAAAGVGLVLAANPSNAMPWGDSLRPSFLAVGHDRVDDGVADEGADVSPDPTLPASAAEPTTAATVEPATTVPATVTPAATEPPTTPPTTVAAPEPPTTVAPTPEPPTTPTPTTPARPKTGEPTPEPPAGTDGTDGAVAPEPPQEPEHPATTAPRTEVHTEATLALSCSLVAGERRSNVACAWTGDTPDGAVRLLVLRGDGTVGRVRLNTEQLGVRSFLDTDAGAGKTFSFVVVFLDANGKSIAHSNGVHLTTPAAPVTTQPPTTQPPTTEPRHDEPTTAPA